MCCLTFILREKLLKGLLFMTGLYYLGLSAWLIYSGVLIKRSGLWVLLSKQAIFTEIDMHQMLYFTCITGGCLCFLAAFTSLVSVCYKFKMCFIPVRLKNIMWCSWD